MYIYITLLGPVPTKNKQTPLPSPPLSFDPIFMKDAEYAESNEKTNFYFRVMVISVPQFSMNFIKIEKLFFFSSYSAHSTFIKTGSKQRRRWGGGGSLQSAYP